MKAKEKKPITVTIINPEALPTAIQKINRHYYEKYIEEQKRKLIVEHKVN